MPARRNQAGPGGPGGRAHQGCPPALGGLARRPGRSSRSWQDPGHLKHTEGTLVSRRPTDPDAEGTAACVGAWRHAFTNDSMAKLDLGADRIPSRQLGRCKIKSVRRPRDLSSPSQLPDTAASPHRRLLSPGTGRLRCQTHLDLNLLIIHRYSLYLLHKEITICWTQWVKQLFHHHMYIIIKMNFT